MVDLGVEPRLEPTDDELYIMASCGHEIYEGDKIYKINGLRLCECCFEDFLADMDLDEICEKMGGAVEKADYFNELTY